MKKDKLNYARAGVDIAAGDQAVEKIKSLAQATFNESVLSEIGSFGGFFKPDLKAFENPVFISSADGVGSKLKLAFMSNRHDTVGEDLVNHCVNDILVHGATPLFFLDYIGIGKLKPEIVAEIIEGFARGCKNARMALLGGETAEMNDFYQPGEYDLAGFILGLVDQDNVINGKNIRPGDVIVGLASNGPHTNGYTLARKIAFEIAGFQFETPVDELGMPVGEALLMTHKSYLWPIKTLLRDIPVRGMAHITGGGIAGNLVRILPDNTRAVIHKGNWPVLPIFQWLKKHGDIDDDDMFEAFNMGIGYVVVLPEGDAERALKCLRREGEQPYIIGEIESGSKKVIFKS